MGKIAFTRTTVLLLFLVLLSSITLADVIVFENYKTTFEYKDKTIVVKKELRLKNVGSSPIIPGEIHFKISENEGDDSNAISVNNFVAKSIRGQTLESRQVKHDSETELIFTIWDPLLPQFFYDFEMTYEIPFKPKGFLFHQIEIPDEKTTIPIKKVTTQFNIPKKYHVTYAPEGEIEKEDDFRTIKWNTKSDLKFEYTSFPIPKMGFPVVNLFWILIIVIFIAIFIIRILSSQE